VLLPNADHAGMMAMAEKMRGNVEALAFEHVRSPFGVVTLSIGGIYVGPDMHSNRETYVKIADDALCEAKRHGRNRIVCLPCGPRPPAIRRRRSPALVPKALAI
jgi:diguanylate cyclase (GGDEF)-like protein